MADLDAIRARDRAAERCKKCETPRGTAPYEIHDPPERGCRWPEEHHDFVPGGGYSGEATQDRHDLLDLIDDIEGAGSAAVERVLEAHRG